MIRQWEGNRLWNERHTSGPRMRCWGRNGRRSGGRNIGARDGWRSMRTSGGGRGRIFGMRSGGSIMMDKRCGGVVVGGGGVVERSRSVCVCVCEIMHSVCNHVVCVESFAA